MISCSQALLTLFASITCACGYRANSGHCTALNVSEVRNLESRAHRVHGHEDSESLAGPQHDIPLTAGAPPDGICAGMPDQCKIERKVGEGSFGVAQLVKCLDIGRVVQKVIPREKFVKEELQPMNLNLPFIMPVFAVYYTAEEVSVFMPYFDAGFSFLDSPSKRSVFTKPEAAMIAWGLYNLHKAGFVHRDLKGANIMKDTGTGITSIIDFGLVSKWPKQDGEPKGNRKYMSPERAAQKWYGPETDWYAFGLLMFHAHAGKSLYNSSELSGMQLRHAFSPEGGCAQIRFDIIDVELQDLILVLLANNDKGEHLYTDGESEGSIIDASTKYLDVETHPVLQHAYFTSGADKIDWNELPKIWPGYESGYCIKGPMNVRVKSIQQQCDEIGKDLAPCICDQPPELEECCCRGTPSYERGVS